MHELITKDSRDAVKQILPSSQEKQILRTTTKILCLLMLLVSNQETEASQCSFLQAVTVIVFFIAHILSSQLFICIHR